MRVLQRRLLLALLLMVSPSSLPLAAQAADSPLEINPNDIVQRIHLSPKEKKWLQAHSRLRVRTIPNNMPYFAKQNGRVYGISIDYLTLISEGYGFDVDYVSGIPWPEAIDRLQQGDGFDLILTINRTEERAKKIRFTKDYQNPPWVIFTRDENLDVSGIEDLRGRTISVEKGFVIDQRLRKQYPAIKRMVVPNTVTALKKLAIGEVDAYIGNLTTGSYIAKQQGFTNIKVVGPTPFGSHSQAMAVRPDWPELAGLINKFIDAMTPQERQVVMERWLGTRSEYGRDSTVIWVVAGIIIVGGLLTLLFLLIRHRRLLAAISRYEKAEQDALLTRRLLECIDFLRREFIKESDPFRLFPAFIQQLQELTESEFGFVGDIKYDETGNKYLVLYGISDLSWDDATRALYEKCREQGLEFRNLHNLLGLASLTGKPVVANDPANDPRAAGFPKGHPVIHTFMGIPVYFGDRLVATVGLANRPNGYDLALVDWLAPVLQTLGQIVVARWDREARYEVEIELEQMARTDPLTGVANRRQYSDVLHELFKRMERYPEPLSLMMIDIDHFKEINDNYGHDAGDAVLVELVGQVRAKIREVDLLARWGGEEFLVLLPNTNLPAARLLAERIRRRINEHVFQQPAHITVSLGVAEYRKGETEELLIKRADQALYKAKQTGRNRLVVAD